ncbi:MAG TPA: redoxin domain-containing protein [Vicinamibacterales bacterium]|nr:redoxin domain-containing protein [Vicinamibacterales bacterium]
MKQMRACVLGILVAALATISPAAQQVRKVDVSKLGPRVGATVPDFSLPDQHGKTRTLQSVMGPKGAMIVFYRSADWCPYCKTQLLDLQAQYATLQKDGLGLVGISYDSQEILAAFSQQHGITFPLLSDVGSATITRYGILNTVALEGLGPNGSDPDVIAQVKLYVSANGATERVRGIPFPGTFIVDRGGRVKARFFEDSYTVRNTVSSIRVKLNNAEMPVPATQVQTRHLDVTTYPSDAAVAPGNRFTLVLRIAPHAGMHVYAPGASNYKIVELKLLPTKYVRPQAAAYPPSETYEFKPLNERVPAYQKPFTLVQEVVLDGQASTRNALKDQASLTIGGALTYQACDDRLCYDPVTVPLSWTVGLKPIVTQATARPATK